MARTVTLGTCIAALCMAFSGPVAAQEAVEPPAEESIESEEVDWSDQQQTDIPGTATDDQIIQFFTLFSSRDEIGALVDPIIAELMEPGPIVENWTETGVDILAEIEGLEGGLAETVLKDNDSEIPTIIDVVGEPSPELTEMESYTLRPGFDELTQERAYMGFAPGMWFETAHQREVRGNALCYSGYVGITLHSQRPVTELSEAELYSALLLFATVDRMSSLEFCVVYEVAASEGYHTRGYLPDGSALLQLDAEMTIAKPIPRAELQATIQDDR